MTTLSSLQDTIQGIGNRLRAENEAQSRDKMNHNLSLDFTRERPGSERRPRPAPFVDFNASRPNTVSARPRGERPKIEPFLFFPQRRQPNESPELNAHVKEISGKKGIITINGKEYKSTVEDMKYISELGNGTSGSVVKMKHDPSGTFIAVKQMHRSGNLEEAKRVFFDLEVVLKSHDCPYIVQCLGCFVTDTDVWICMELMSTCLDKLMKKFKQSFPEAIIGKIAVATLKALHYLKESHGVIHRDVKPSNILLDEKGNIKLCDFGISGRLVDSKAKTRSAGCAAYMAPERIDPPDPNKPDYDIRADVWSLGITLVELATGQFPYKDCKTDFEVLTKVLQDAPPVLPPDTGFSAEFRDFVKDCLVKDYKQRPKYKRLLDYPFIKKYEKENVDVAKWFAEVSKTIESRAKTWPQTIFPAHNARSSRTGTRTASSLPTNEAPPTPPRRRSRTPDNRSQERFKQFQQKIQKEEMNKGILPPSLNPQSLSTTANGSLASYSRSQVPASPSLSRAISSSPARNILPTSSPSRALSASPVPRPLLPPLSNQGYSSNTSHSHLHSSSNVPLHQYGVPSSSSVSYNYPVKHYSQMYSQYSNPYSQSVPSRNYNYTPHNSQSVSSGKMNTNIGQNSFSSHGSPRFCESNIGSSTTNSHLFTPSTFASYSLPSTNSSTSSSSSSCSGSQITRKTPEPVSHHHSSYLPPHVSPLVSRRIVESRAAAAAAGVPTGLAATERALAHTHLSSSSGPSSLPSTFSTPHYRYTQEAYYNSRPYYTPEPQRRIFPRLGNP